MPPYRANLGGAFGSGYFPAPVQRIDVGGAITAIGNQATTLLQSAYLRKVAEANNAQRAKNESLDRMRQERLDRENAEFRARQLAIQERTAANAGLIWDGVRGVFIQRPDAGALGMPGAMPEAMPDAMPGAVPPDANGMSVPPAMPMAQTAASPMPSAPESPMRLTTPGAPRAIGVPGVSPRLNVPQSAQIVTPAQEAEGSAWLAQNRRNPDAVAAVATVQAANPALTEGQAAYLARETNQSLTPKPAPTPEPGPGRAPTEAQEKSYFYLGMMDQSLPTLNRLAPLVRGDRISFALSPAVPGFVGNRSLSDDEQALINAARVFATGILRKESGAAITDAEVRDTFQKYIPLSGDSPAVKAQKEANRNAAIALLRDLAAPASKYYEAMRGGAAASPSNDLSQYNLQPTPDR